MNDDGLVRLVVPVGPDDHVRGPAAAPVTLVEYGDFECPYCGVAYPIVRALEAAYPQTDFLWLDTEESDAEVFWIDAASL